MDDESLEDDICRQEYVFKTHLANEVSKKCEWKMAEEDVN